MFITFEGPDGSGKTTALEGLKKYLDGKNFKYVFTREPGAHSSKEANQIRKIILDKENNITPMTEAILYAADRRLHLEKLIWPALRKNEVVLCDRYLDSSLAYQGKARKLGIKEIKELNEIVTEKTYPDVTIFFDITPTEAAERVDSRAPKDRMELEPDSFREDVYTGYQEVIKMFPERFRRVDASKSKEEVLKQVIEIINKELSI